MKLSDLAQKLGCQYHGADCEFHSVSIDSRRIVPGQLFVAIVGERFDAHHFLQEAQRAGAIAALVDRCIETELPIIQVANTRRALGQLAQLHRNNFSIPTVALTGSCGKTTTRAMLESVLSECGIVLASKRSFNNEIGVPLTLLDLNAKHQFAVLELGANHPGEIAYLSNLVQPIVALITNIGPAHLQGFGSLEGVARAKFEIFSGLKKGGTAIVNTQDPSSQHWCKLIRNHPIIGFGDNAEFSAHQIQIDANGYPCFLLHTPLGSIDIRLSLVGQHNILNALACAAAAQQIGASLENIKAGLEKVSALPGRFLMRTGKHGARIIDDTYNANPASVKAALALLARYPGQRYFVLGTMGELGEQSLFYHEKMGQLAQTHQIDQLFTYGAFAKETADAFGKNAHHFTDQRALIAALQSELAADKTILIKGSRSMRMENVVAALIDPSELNGLN